MRVPAGPCGVDVQPVEARGVDVQPVEAHSPEARRWAARLAGSSEDSEEQRRTRGPGQPAPTPFTVEPPETGRTRGRARGHGHHSLGNEGHSLSTRKLELLLAEPEKNKRKQHCVA